MSCPNLNNSSNSRCLCRNFKPSLLMVRLSPPHSSESSSCTTFFSLCLECVGCTEQLWLVLSTAPSKQGEQNGVHANQHVVIMHEFWEGSCVLKLSPYKVFIKRVSDLHLFFQDPLKSLQGILLLVFDSK